MDTPLTDNCKKVLAFLQEHDTEWVGKDLGEACGIVKGIHPVMNSLVNRGLAVKGSVERDYTNPKGVTAPKAYVTYSLTEAGREYSFDE